MTSCTKTPSPLHHPPHHSLYHPLGTRVRFGERSRGTMARHGVIPWRLVYPMGAPHGARCRLGPSWWWDAPALRPSRRTKGYVCVCMYVRACVCMCVRVRVYVCVCVCVTSLLNTSIWTYANTPFNAYIISHLLSTIFSVSPHPNNPPGHMAAQRRQHHRGPKRHRHGGICPRPRRSQRLQLGHDDPRGIA